MSERTRMTTPVALDFAALPLALAGNGPALGKRLALLLGEGLSGFPVYSPQPSPELAARAGSSLIVRLPSEDEVAQLRVLFVAGLDPGPSAELARIARRGRVLINVEDMPTLCDFHVPSILRRGALALSISTGGASPTLSRRMRAWLEQLLPLEWEGRLARIAELRARLRAEGATPGEVMAASDALIEREGWLPPG